MTSVVRSRITAAAVVVGLLAGLGFELVSWHRQQHLADLRSEAIEVANAQVVDLTTLDPGRIDQTLASLRKRTTGDFRRQLQGIAQAFSTVVREGKVTARGDVVEAAVRSVSDKRASVLVANRTRFVNADSKKPTTRAYRISVDLLRVKGVWLVSGMRFVQ